MTVTCRRLLSALLLLVCFSISTEAADPPAVVLLEGSGISWRQARQTIEQYGGRLDVILVPNVLVGNIPAGAAAALQQAMTPQPGFAATAASSVLVVRTRAEAEALLAGPPPGVFAIQTQASTAAASPEARAALRILAPQGIPMDQDSRFRVLPGGLVEIRPINEWESPPLLPPQPQPLPAGKAVIAEAIGNTFNNTSGFLAGDVGVAILRPESTGSASGDSINQENWTSEEVTTTLARVTSALNKLVSVSPSGKLTFIVRTESFGSGVAGTVESDYEAIKYSNWTSNVVLNFLGKLGYTQADGFQRLREWANDIRADLGTDWAYGFIVVDNSTDTSKGRASAFLNGPAAWLFQSNSDAVYHHESGHIWGAVDEYHPDAAQSPIDLWGYTQIPNANSQYNDGKGFFGGAGEGIPALQIDNRDYVSPWGRGAWGTWDLDGDGINDNQDTFPIITLNAPSGTSTFTMTGTATATPMKRETAQVFTGLDADITINKITLVEWRLNRGPWQDATPSDGAFNASSEAFTLTTAALRNGPYVLEFRASDNFGNSTLLPARITVTASGSAVTNNSPLPVLVVAPTLGSTSTTFQFSAAGSLDYEDSANLQYRWDFDNDGTYDTSLSSNPIASQSYGSAGSKSAKVEVRDSGGATTTRLVTLTVAASNTSPSAKFTIDKGAVFATSPAVFNFDASGVGDGEDAASTLQVRWDFDDDGVWDTGFSTTKTIAHDYAQSLPVTVSNESGSSYLYAGNSTYGYSQSFVATSAGIGKAEMILAHWNDNTPGGTCTGGIRSALSGSFLTSTTINQAAIREFDWNLFDFGDVTVTNGNTYYLVLICSDTDIMWRASTSNPFPGGEHRYSFDSGSNWGPTTDYDHVFRIYDRTVATVPLTKSRAWRVRMEVKDSTEQTSQTVRDIWTNAYDTPPSVTLSSSATSGTTATTFNLTATGTDANSGTTWDGLVHYRWDVNGDGNFETEFASTNTRSATFAQPGVYLATVEVRDRYHAVARGTVAITVAPTSGATQLSMNAGNNQIALPNSALAIAPSVLVRDAGNSPVSGAAVTFTVVSGGGKITNATQITNASGIATLGSWTVGPNAGANTLSVQLPETPQVAALTFNATAGVAQTLTLSKSGSGSGTVTSNPEGINCGSTCSFDYVSETTVTLTATPAVGSSFTGWTGGSCSGMATCDVTMNAAKTVTAGFTIRKRGGQITSN
jgi:hypothetical protein